MEIEIVPAHPGVKHLEIRCETYSAPVLISASAGGETVAARATKSATTEGSTLNVEVERVIEVQPIVLLVLMPHEPGDIHIYTSPGPQTTLSEARAVRIREAE
jgi:hypothetical protein